MSWASVNSIPDSIDGDGRDFEPELEPLMCATCGTEIEVGPEGPYPTVCPACLQPLDLETQFAYSRGRDAFAVGQEILIRISPRLRKRNLFTTEELEGLEYYKQAYSSLQLAFQGVLAEQQRWLGVEMMAAIVNILLQHQLISELEFGFWGSLNKEQNIQQECVEVQHKMTGLPHGLFTFLVRLRWHLRLRQLQKALRELDANIHKFQRLIRFTEPVNARRIPDRGK
ncbi:MAG: hypothetical protein HPY85_00690 [Anaerolineae bacterium]|nr:hypothetical protein [Anaerolineae bacterium]